MTLEMLNLSIAMPEMFLLALACTVLVVDVYLKDDQRNITYVLSQLGLIVTLVLISQQSPQSRELAFNGLFVNDLLATVLKYTVVLLVAVVFVYSRRYLQERNIFKGEFYVLGLFGLLGMMVMISANHYLSMYLGLELLSLSLYAMVAFNRENPNAAEAAMKYFVLGAIASGMLLYGMSMVYGMTGSLNIVEVAVAIDEMKGDNLVLIFGLVFMVIGISFKLGAVPFHMWIPDVYHGSPTTVTSYIATAPKVAGFAMVIRLLAESMGSLQADWQGMLIILSVLSMIVGNVIAIAQTNLKRLLAYSTISHVGFIMLGLLSGNQEGYSAAMFYTLTYALMSLGGFGVIILLTRKGFEADNIDDLKGLNQRSPWFAFIMLIIIFSMAGVPPTVGFWAKLAVLKAVVNVDMLWLALVAVFFSIIGIFYYLRIIKIMYFDQAEDKSEIDCNRDMQIALSANGLSVLMLGLYPAALMSLCIAAFS
ncbi:MAG: NADH-quinone oxidoreductase subunit NuoN [endosymbiont of Galathealinum brachiosum]|uniref:NADH-quinone oxidoreductase subunit N n=1 Tax=endosymbiont of Galathealinum brachiosum TaxID=2200906 RepID=A0A370D8F1_9GAMM|nr:MAG: NADH-quinone oxidoreductase subunit NuoN [endosymbiont of Galathealinum brachiosum]